MKLYQSRKIVQAARILAVPNLTNLMEHYDLGLEGTDRYERVAVSREWLNRHRPYVGGYFVRHADGHASFSPAETFEKSHVELPLPTKITREALLAKIIKATYEIRPDGRTTLCELTMENGTSVQGFSVCAVASEFIKEYGEQAAYNDALNEAWAFEGYLLKQMRFLAGLQ